MAAVCAKCNENVTAIPDSIACCNIACSAVYHSQCVGIRRNFLTLIAEVPNLHFYCDTCCKSPPNIGNATDNSSLNQAAFLKQPVADDISGQLAGIQESLKRLTDAFTGVPT